MNGSRLPKGNIITSNIFTFINPNRLDYFDEVFYPNYIRDKNNKKPFANIYDKYYNFRIMTKSIE